MKVTAERLETRPKLIIGWLVASGLRDPELLEIYARTRLGPLIYLNDSRQFTLTLGLAEFTRLHTPQWHLPMAAATVVIAPVLVLFFSTQRYFIEGIALTGTKG